MKTTHTHHIVPRHAGGTDDPSNLVELTPQEHADAHNLLWCLYKNPLDKLAERMLLGEVKFNDPDFRSYAGKVGGAKTRDSGKLKKAQAISHEKSKKEYLVTTPDGEDIRIRGFNSFCDSVGLSRSTAKMLLKEDRVGTQRNAKGWRIRYV